VVAAELSVLIAGVIIFAHKEEDWQL